jgi:hypothetical protein
MVDNMPPYNDLQNTAGAKPPDTAVFSTPSQTLPAKFFGQCSPGFKWMSNNIRQSKQNFPYTVLSQFY